MVGVCEGLVCTVDLYENISAFEVDPASVLAGDRGGFDVGRV